MSLRLVAISAAGLLLISTVVGTIQLIKQYGKSQYELGVVSTEAAYQAKLSEIKQQAEQREREVVKKYEDEAKRINDTVASLNASNNGLRNEINRFRSRANQAATARGETADPAVGVLAELFEQSVERNRTLAAYADRAVLAGQTCEAIVDGSANPTGQ